MKRIGKTCVLFAASGTLFTGTGCFSGDTAASLAELTASTAGSVVEIFVGRYLNNWVQDNNPDPSAAIADQNH